MFGQASATRANSARSEPSKSLRLQPRVTSVRRGIHVQYPFPHLVEAIQVERSSLGDERRELRRGWIEHERRHAPKGTGSISRE